MTEREYQTCPVCSGKGTTEAICDRCDGSGRVVEASPTELMQQAAERNETARLPGLS